MIARNRFKNKTLYEMNKASEWRLILNHRKRISKKTDMNLLWLEYLEGSDLGYFTDKNLASIRNLLNISSDEIIIEKIKEYNPNIVEQCFNHDINSLCKISLVKTLLDDIRKWRVVYEFIISDKQNTFEHLETISLRLNTLLKYCFGWNPERFLNPMDNYRWMANSYHFFINFLFKDFENSKNRYIIEVIEKIKREIWLMCNGIEDKGEEHCFNPTNERN